MIEQLRRVLPKRADAAGMLEQEQPHTVGEQRRVFPGGGVSVQSQGQQPQHSCFHGADYNYPVGSKVDLVERLLERGVADDPQRAITANRQPGK
jgi:hypothetical protein